MPTHNSITLTYEQDVDKVKFDFYMFPIDLIPALVKQANEHLFFEASRGRFDKERALYAQRAGLTVEGQLSLALKLKNN